MLNVIINPAAGSRSCSATAGAASLRETSVAFIVIARRTEVRLTGRLLTYVKHVGARMIGLRQRMSVAEPRIVDARTRSRRSRGRATAGAASLREARVTLIVVTGRTEIRLTVRTLTYVTRVGARMMGLRQRMRVAEPRIVDARSRRATAGAASLREACVTLIVVTGRTEVGLTR